MDLTFVIRRPDDIRPPRLNILTFGRWITLRGGCDMADDDGLTVIVADQQSAAGDLTTLTTKFYNGVRLRIPIKNLSWDKIFTNVIYFISSFQKTYIIFSLYLVINISGVHSKC